MVPAASNNSDNPYAAPRARVRQPSRGEGGRPLATRLSRLIAFILDSAVGVLITLPILIIFPIAMTADGEPDFTDGVPVGAMAYLGALGAMMIIQVVLLWTRSQTIGTVVMRIRIDEHGTDERAGPLKTILLRGFVVGLLMGIPVVGILFALVDFLFIFGKDRRCVHDLIAGTVVRVAP